MSERTSEYRIEHPRWKIWLADSFELKANIATLYGEKFVEPLKAKPVSAFIAEARMLKCSVVQPSHNQFGVDRANRFLRGISALTPGGVGSMGRRLKSVSQLKIKKSKLGLANNCEVQALAVQPFPRACAHAGGDVDAVLTV